MSGRQPTITPKCRKCGTTDTALLCKGSHTVSGFINYCKPCKAKDTPYESQAGKSRKRKKKDKVPTPPSGKAFFDHYDVPCRNGCNTTIPVNMWPGDKPSKYHYCPSCKNKDAGLSLQGIYN